MALFTQEKRLLPTSLTDSTFEVPPFSVLDTKLPYWHSRKQEWSSVIGKSTDGRYTHRQALPDHISSSHNNDKREHNPVSEFDPVLCEMMYKWFSKPGMSVFDPFAGGCVRGITASVMGRNYTGVDLSSYQIDTNNRQVSKFSTFFHSDRHLGNINYLLGDTDVVADTIEQKFDMVFTCPPYYNLETYSKHPADLSNLPTYEIFLAKYKSILEKSVNLLNDDSFMVLVLAEMRNQTLNMSDTYYLGLIPDTINILRNINNIKYYNEMILLNAFGSLPLRVNYFFNRSRKIGKCHQNILVFYKGDIANIGKKFI